MLTPELIAARGLIIFLIIGLLLVIGSCSNEEGLKNDVDSTGTVRLMDQGYSCTPIKE